MSWPDAVQGPGPVALLPIVLAVSAWLVYVAAQLRLQWRGRLWSVWRTCSFAAGILLLILAFMPPISHLAHQSFSGHMIQHLLLGMFVPLGLVFGAPGTLLLRTLPVGAARGLVRFLSRRIMRALTHPLTAAILDIGGMYLLYLTSLYALSQSNVWVHGWLQVHFVVSGYLFTWAIAGPDPAPHRPSLRLRLIVLFLALAAHGGLAKLMFGFGYPQGLGYALADLERAAQWMYYGGDAAEALLVIALCLIGLRRRRYRLEAAAFQQPSVAS